MSQISINGVTYEVTRMRRVMDQAHVARKIMPLLEGVAGGYLQLQREALGLANGASSPPFDTPPRDTGPSAAAAEVGNGGNGDGEEAEIDPIEALRQEATLLRLFGPISRKLAEMPDNDFEDIVNRCMGAIYRIDSATQVRAPMVGASGAFMFEAELDLVGLITLTVEVIKVNIGPSLRGALQNALGAAQSMSPSTLSR